MEGDGCVKIHYSSQPVTKHGLLPETTTQVFSPLSDKRGPGKFPFFFGPYTDICLFFMA